MRSAGEKRRVGSFLRLLITGLLTAHLFLVAFPNISDAAEALEFFHVFEGKIPQGRSMDLEILKLRDYKGPNEFYVERSPTLSIDVADIREVKIEALKIYDDRTGRLKKDEGPDISYQANFSLTGKVAAALVSFSSKYRKESFDIRLANKPLAFVILQDRLSGPEFAIILGGKTREWINELLSPLKDKLRWEEN